MNIGLSSNYRLQLKSFECKLFPQYCIFPSTTIKHFVVQQRKQTELKMHTSIYVDHCFIRRAFLFQVKFMRPSFILRTRTISFWDRWARDVSICVQRSGTPHSAGVCLSSAADLHLIVCPCSKTQCSPAFIPSKLASTCWTQLRTGPAGLKRCI